MNLANNHAFDFGASAQAETIAALKRAGLRFTGRPGEIAVVRKGATKVAFVGFAPYPWAQDLLDIEGAVKLVRKADRKADVVVVTMHAGAEGDDEPARPTRGRRGSSASRAATSSRSRTRSSAPAPTSSSATARTSSAGSSGTAGA